MDVYLTYWLSNAWVGREEKILWRQTQKNRFLKLQLLKNTTNRHVTSSFSVQMYLRGQDPFMYPPKYSHQIIQEPKTFLTLHFPVFVTSSGGTVASRSTAKQQHPEINWVWLLFRPWWKHFKLKNKSLYSIWKKLQSERRERTGRFKGMEKNPLV